MPFLLLFASLIAINLPLGYWICRRLNLTAYWQIVAVGLALYFGSAEIVGLLMVGFPSSWHQLLEALAVGLFTALRLLPLGLPLILGLAVLVQRRLVGRSLR